MLRPGKASAEKRTQRGHVQLLRVVQCTGAYVAAAGIDQVTMLLVDHIGHKDPRWLCKLPECLVVPVWP